MSRWKLQAATLAAMLVAATVSLPVCARELQPLATATPEQVGMSAERRGRITTVLKKEIADGKLPGAVVMVRPQGKEQPFVCHRPPTQGTKYAHEARDDLPHLLTDQAAGVGGGDDAGRRWCHPAHRSHLQIPAGLQRHASERGNHGRRWESLLHECAGG